MTYLTVLGWNLPFWTREAVVAAKRLPFLLSPEETWTTIVITHWKGQYLLGNGSGDYFSMMRCVLGINISQRRRSATGSASPQSLPVHPTSPALLCGGVPWGLRCLKNGLGMSISSTCKTSNQVVPVCFYSFMLVTNALQFALIFLPGAFFGQLLNWSVYSSCSCYNRLGILK